MPELLQNNREDWFRKILQESKIEHADQLSRNFLFRFKQNPVQDQSDLPPDILPVVNTSSPYKIAVSFSMQDYFENKQKIQQALRAGADSLMISLSNQTTESWKSLQSSFDLEYINLVLLGEKEDLPMSLKQAKEDIIHHTVPEKNWFAFPNLSSSEEAFSVWSRNLEVIANSSYACVSFEMNDQFLACCIQLRALQKLLRELLEEHFQLWVKLNFNQNSEKHTFIHASSQSLAAQITNCTGVVLSADQFTEFELIHLVQMQHLLQYESKLKSVVDPLYGSYAVESQTDQVVQFFKSSLNKTKS